LCQKSRARPATGAEFAKANSPQSTIGRTSPAANRTFDEFSGKTARTKTMLSGRLDRMQRQQERWTDDARDRIREKSMMAASIAMAAGFSLRRLLSRRR